MLPEFPVLLFYKYVPVADPQALATAQRELCVSLGLKGRVLVATEGINGTVAGARPAIETYIAALRADERFADMELKISEGDEKTFPRMMVKLRPEIVALGAGELTPDMDNHLTPTEWKRMLEEDEDVVLVDVRNRYESAAGKFADAVVCDIKYFRDLPGYMDQLEELKNRKVLMYCTGGVRCEKASALFRREGFEQVYQLHGGIVNYQKEFGNEHWLGECFVFDQRMTVRVEEDLESISRCAHTGRPTNRFVNCLHDPCHILFLLAEETQQENDATRLCPQCLAAGWTVDTADYKGSPARAGK